jgi:hypothetical protein
MSITSDFLFNNLGRIGADEVDSSQKNIENTRYANYMLDNFLINTHSQDHVNFATSYLNMNFRGNPGGEGLSGQVIDDDSKLLHSESVRPLDKLQLNQRTFVTVPYLGRGYGNPIVESQLQQGEAVTDRKSLNTIMEQNFIDYKNYPLINNVKERVSNPSFSVEEVALDGWVRGGVDSRNLEYQSK